MAGSAVEESNLSVQIAALRSSLGRTGRWRLDRHGPSCRLSVRWPHASLQRYQSCPPRTLRRPFQRPSIAVLPFTNLSGSSDQRYFGDAIANDIITALTRFKWFSVVARNSSFAFRELSVDVREIAKRLGARYVVEGSHRQVGHRIRITRAADRRNYRQSYLGGTL